MALINCPECQKEVSDQAVNCPNCGFQIQKHLIQQRQKIQIEQSHQDSLLQMPKKPIIQKGTAIVLIVLGFILYLIFWPSSNTSKLPHTPDQSEAYLNAENFVKQGLKSPSTAKFPSYAERQQQTSILGAGKFKITSWVDSQNGFGAMIRTNWSCTITFIGDKVKCEDLVFNNP